MKGHGIMARVDRSRSVGRNSGDDVPSVQKNLKELVSLSARIQLHAGRAIDIRVGFDEDDPLTDVIEDLQTQFADDVERFIRACNHCRTFPDSLPGKITAIFGKVDPDWRPKYLRAMDGMERPINRIRRLGLIDPKMVFSSDLLPLFDGIDQHHRVIRKLAESLEPPPMPGSFREPRLATRSANSPHPVGAFRFLRD
jgi:hypothetical protein